MLPFDGKQGGNEVAAKRASQVLHGGTAMGPDPCQPSCRGHPCLRDFWSARMRPNMRPPAGGLQGRGAAHLRITAISRQRNRCGVLVPCRVISVHDARSQSRPPTTGDRKTCALQVILSNYASHPHLQLSSPAAEYSDFTRGSDGVVLAP